MDSCDDKELNLINMDKDKIIEMINSYWKFDDDQQPLSSWHDKQDLISAIEQLSIPLVSNTEGKLCDKCHDTGNFYLGTTCPKCKEPFRSVKA
jgi:hypothetical protein